MHSIHDHFLSPPSGRLFFQVFLKGKLIETFDETNLIVDVSKALHARLLGGDVTGRSVTQIGFGTNGSAPVAGNTALIGQFAKAIDAVSYPTVNSVRFDFTLASGENNGMAILEFGLLTANGSLFARKVRSTALTKTVDISIVGTWTITY